MLTERQFFIEICEAINDEYGDTLHIDGTDMAMAYECINRLSIHIDFPKEKISDTKLKSWRRKLIEDFGDIDPDENDEWEIKFDKYCKLLC